MATYLIETSTLSHMMREDETVMERVRSLSGSDQLITCPVVSGEIMFGVGDLPEGKRRRKLARKAEALFAALASRDISYSTADYYSNLKCCIKRAGKSLSDNDLWIAAVALENQAVLVAADSDHRPLTSLAALEVEDWTKPVQRRD